MARSGPAGSLPGEPPPCQPGPPSCTPKLCQLRCHHSVSTQYPSHCWDRKHALRDTVCQCPVAGRLLPSPAAFPGLPHQTGTCIGTQPLPFSGRCHHVPPIVFFALPEIVQWFSINVEDHREMPLKWPLSQLLKF